MITLRAFRADDTASCLAILDSNVPEYFLAADRHDVEKFLGDLENLGVRYFVVEDSAKLVAAGGVAVREGMARMCWGMVDRALHRRGFGTLLLLVRLLEGARMGATHASLETIPATTAFFERRGFAITGGHDDYYAPGMHRRDMTLALDEETIGRLEAELARIPHQRT